MSSIKNGFKKYGLISAKKVLAGSSINKDRKDEVIMMGVINAGVLNVRTRPGKHGSVIGKLKRGNLVSIYEKTQEGWYRLKYDNRNAYVYGKFVNFLKGQIIANVLNMRSEPNLKSKVLGKFSKGDEVYIAQKFQKWHKIIYKEGFAYVYNKYVKIQVESDTKKDSKTKEIFLRNNERLLKVQVEPDEKINVPTSSREGRRVAKTFNNFGGILSVLSKEIGIDIATAIAVLAVESGGSGFGKTGKVLIRFENHLFDSFWGKRNRKVYDKHFRYNKSKRWSGHLFRKDKKSDWMSFHGNQNKEWEVLDFAYELNPKAALFSTSYGAPQILGTNYKVVGYKDTAEMLKFFSDDIRYHILALFDFFNPAMVKHLQRREFTSFARYYNGRGQENRYGKFIKKHYEEFRKLT